jgi:hypothetical protein
MLIIFWGGQDNKAKSASDIEAGQFDFLYFAK